MKTIATLYGGDATKCEELDCGDILNTYLIDKAFLLLTNDKFLNIIRNRTNKIKIKMSKRQLAGLSMKNLSLLFVSYFNYNNLTLYNDSENKDNYFSIEECTISYNDKQVKIITTSR